MISVILATHDGEPTLPRTLDALGAVRVPDEGLEILAIDNASTDRTPEILADHADRLPLRRLTEPRRGKSFALNRGIEAARGRLLVFTDDDVLPDERWLEAYCRAADARPTAGIFAGQVRHHWDCPPPDWLESLARAGFAYAGTPADRPEGPVEWHQFKGLNFMVRRAALGAIRFDEGVGNFTGGSGAGGEDILLPRQVIAAGSEAWFVPDARVRHIVRASQVGLIPLLRRYLRIGRSQAVTDPRCFDPEGRQVLGWPATAFRLACRQARGMAGRWVRGDRRGAAREMVELAMTAGRASEWRRMQMATATHATASRLEAGER